MLPATLRPLGLALMPMLALALPAAAGPHPRPAPSTVAVSGHGEASVSPDLAVVGVGVTVQAPTATEAMSQNATRQSAVIDALKSLGVAPRDIQTSGLNLSPVQTYPQDGKPPVITGYQASNVVSVRVRALADLGKVLDQLVQAGANEIQGINFQREDAAAMEAEARRKAVENAAARAEVIAEAAGLTLGRIVSVNDSGGSQPAPAPMMRMAGSMKDAASTPIESGELAIAADVQVVWEMIPEGGPAEGMEDCPMHDMHHGQAPGAPIPAAPEATPPAAPEVTPPATPTPTPTPPSN